DVACAVGGIKRRVDKQGVDTPSLGCFTNEIRLGFSKAGAGDIGEATECSVVVGGEVWTHNLPTRLLEFAIRDRIRVPRDEILSYNGVGGRGLQGRHIFCDPSQDHRLGTSAA